MAFRPEFVVGLVRTPHLSPRYAQFRVPLNLNKLDLKDYLKNVYDVDVVSIRSYVQQQPITRIRRDGMSIGPWRRPKSEKRMTVELKEPFVWPEEPDDFARYVPVGIGCRVEMALGNYCIADESLADGRKSLGLLPSDTRKKCKSRIDRNHIVLKSPMKKCGRHLKSRQRN